MTPDKKENTPAGVSKDYVDQKFENVDEKFSNIEKDLERIENRVNAHSGRLDSIDKSQTSQGVQLTGIFSSLEMNTKTIENLALAMTSGLNDIKANFVSKEHLKQRDEQSASQRWIWGLMGTIAGGVLMMLFYAIVAFVTDNS